MSRISDRQQSFLRAFVNNPSGPAAQDWPSPAILRRWLRKPRFRSALNSLQLSIRFQTDFHIASAATSAARNLDNADAPPDPKQLQTILRLSHLRQRFTATLSPEPAPAESHNDWLKKLPPANRLTREEFHALALDRRYAPDLQSITEFPAPLPQDTFYYQLLQNPQALLWWMKIYEHKTNDQRFRKILDYCKPILPIHFPAKLPFFPNMPHIDPEKIEPFANRGTTE